MHVKSDQSSTSSAPSQPVFSPDLPTASTWYFGLQSACALAAMLLVLGLFMGGAQPVAVGLFTEPWDKLAHAGVFFVLAVLMTVALRGVHLLHGRKSLNLSQALVLAALLAMLVAGADEIHQIWLPGRVADWGDWLADVGGIALGLFVVRWYHNCTRV